MTDSEIVIELLKIISPIHTISPIKKGIIKAPVRHRNRKHYKTIHKEYDEDLFYSIPDVLETESGALIPYKIKGKRKPLELLDCELCIVPDMYRTGKECYKLQSVSGGIGVDLDIPKFKTIVGARDYSVYRLGIIPQIMC